MVTKIMKHTNDDGSVRIEILANSHHFISTILLTLHAEEYKKFLRGDTANCIRYRVFGEFLAPSPLVASVERDSER